MKNIDFMLLKFYVFKFNKKKKEIANRRLGDCRLGDYRLGLRSRDRFNIFDWPDWPHDRVMFICLSNLVFSIGSFPQFFQSQGIFLFFYFYF
jgi:hypothetical protein